MKYGEYVRTTNKGIKRIDTIFENKPINRYGYEIGSEWDGKLYSIIKTTEITKHSKNIIDLIEIGDIIQIKRGLYDDYNFIFICSDEDIITATETIEEYAINILTHEQYEQNCYRVEE